MQCFILLFYVKNNDITNVLFTHIDLTRTKLLTVFISNRTCVKYIFIVATQKILKTNVSHQLSLKAILLKNL